MLIGAYPEDAQTMQDNNSLFGDRSPTPTTPSEYATPELNSVQDLDTPLSSPPTVLFHIPPSSDSLRGSDTSSLQVTPRATPVQSEVDSTLAHVTPTTLLDATDHPNDGAFTFRHEIYGTQVQTPSKRRAGSEGASGKCRYREVDYSQSLRETLHGKDRQVARLQQKLREQEQDLKEQYGVLHNQVLSTTRLEFEKQSSDLQTILKQREDEYTRVLSVTRKELESHNTDLKSLLRARHDEVTTLRNSLKAQVQEHRTFVAQIQRNQVLVTQKHDEELCGIRKQLENDMRAQIDNFLQLSSSNLNDALRQRDREMEAKTTEMEQRLQAELDRKAKQMTAEKETELANLEQRYMRNRGIPAQPHPITVSAQAGQHPDVIPIPNVAMDTEAAPNVFPNQNSMPTSTSTEPVSTPPPSTTSSQPAPTTPSLDAIRRLKKRRAGGVTRKTHLVGVSVEEEPTASREAAEEKPQPEQPNIQNMAETIARAVEVAIRNALGNGGMPHPTKPSPRRKRVEDAEVALEKETEPSQHRDFILGEVRRLFKDVFKISQDTDFIAHIPAQADDVYAFEREDGAGPDSDNLAFDLSRSSTSLWNSTILEILLRMFQKRSSEEKWPVAKLDNYVRVELRNRYKKLRTAWLRGQPKLTQNGVLETPIQVEARLLEHMKRLGKQSRQTTRRRNKFHRRTMVLDHIVKLKVESGDDDLDSWKWLQGLIKLLGEHGMSSEESAVEDDVQHVLRVKQMSWRRNIDRELDIIDTERLIANDIFSPQGARPVKRIHAADNPTTSRNAVEGLPIDLYDSAWVAGLTQRECDALGIPKDRFVWRRIAVT